MFLVKKRSIKQLIQNFEEIQEIEETNPQLP